MKASELIERLQAAIAEHGDCDVMLGDPAGLSLLTEAPYVMRTDDSFRSLLRAHRDRADAMIASGEWQETGDSGESEWIGLVKVNPTYWIVLE